MKNLAGHVEPDPFVQAELDEAGITIITLDAPQDKEVRTSIQGQFGHYHFERAWYYWMVTGPVPLEIARAMYADLVGKSSVRVVGQCGCPPPDEWAQDGCVQSYHIDTQEGLNLFSKMVGPIQPDEGSQTHGG